MDSQTGFLHLDPLLENLDCELIDLNGLKRVNMGRMIFEYIYWLIHIHILFRHLLVFVRVAANLFKNFLISVSW